MQAASSEYSALLLVAGGRMRTNTSTERGKPRQGEAWEHQLAFPHV